MADTYYTGFVNRYPSRKYAGMCEVPRYTSFFMRRRILEIMSGCLPPSRAEAGMQIQLDEIYIRESFKGPDRGNRIPRRGRKRDSRTGAGLNKGLKCVVTGINDAGDTFSDVAGNGKSSCARMYVALEKLTLSMTFVTAGREQSYVSLLKALDAGIHSAYDDPDYGHLSHLDSYHSRIGHFLYPFKGISSGWLMHHLGWQEPTGASRESLSDRSIPGRVLRDVTVRHGRPCIANKIRWIQLSDEHIPANCLIPAIVFLTPTG